MGDDTARPAARPSPPDAIILPGDVEAQEEPVHTYNGEERRRTATWQDAAYHSVTAMVGAGVLGLPSTLVPLGWAGGIIILIFSFWVSWYTYKLLVCMHEVEVPDPASKDGSAVLRFDRYQDLTSYVFGKRRGKWALLPFQAAVLVGLAVTYTVVGGDDLHAFATDYATTTPAPPAWVCYIVFGAAQVLLSQLPDFSSLGWVSALGAVMSIGYSAIATGLSIAAAVHRPAGAPRINYAPKVEASPGRELIEVCAAISTILFAYGGHNIALEIQATLPHPPTRQRMMRGVNLAFVVTGLLYFGVALSGYAALGAATGPNIILALGNGPKWLRNTARILVVVHVLAAFQVYTHPVFDWIETGASRVRVAGRTPFSYGSVASRLLLRTLYVAAVTLAAVLVPFFSDLMSLVGALAVTPTTFVLPPLLWIMLRRPRRWGLEWTVNAGLVVITAAMGLAGVVSAVYLIAAHAAGYRLFASA